MSDVRSWLEGLGLGDYAEAFEVNRIDADVLPHLTERDLSELGLPIGPRRKLLLALQELDRSPREKQLAPTAAPPRMAERRHLTVMFCDLVGSTALSETLDPEDLRTVMQAYQQAAGAVIERYEGHVAQYLGDGLMSYFGWPAAHEDDAERALRAALEIVEAVKSVAAPAPLRLRIGVASGPVVVGETGAGDAAVPKLAVGETPNLAARLQGLADPDEILITAATRRLVGEAFELEPLGEHALKGIAEPIGVWRVAGVAATEGRFEAAHGAHLSPFVGREAELTLVMERWRQAKDGEGQVVLLCGEPGIGKSRITQVLREQVANEPHTRLRYQCSPYHTHSALHSFIDQLERAAGFKRSDDTAAKLDKLETLLRAALDDPWAPPLFAALLSLDAGNRYPPLSLTPQAQKEATLSALAAQAGALAAKQPVLMIFEDVHWIDPTTQEALDLLLPAIAAQRVLALITYRPEYQPPWSGLAAVTRLALTRLGRRHAAVMVEQVAGTKPLPNEVLDQIVDKTDGVPLFVEELTKTVLESGLVEEGPSGYRLTGPLADLAIPSTLEDSLIARLDRLATVREVAQTGACIGRHFSHDLLAAVSPLAASALDDALRQLVDAELMFRTGTPGNPGYMFKHALVQDAAYKSLLRARRQAIHTRIAGALLAHFAQLAESAPETLAHHYTEGGIFDQAVSYWRSAAERASARFANAEAIGHYRKGLATLGRVPDGSERVGLELALRVGLISSLRMADRYGEALEELDRAEALATESNRIGELSRIHHLRGNIYFPLGKIEQCLAEHQAAWSFAKEAHSTEDEARALGGLGDAYYMRGQLQSAHERFDRCVTLCHMYDFGRIEIAYLAMRATTHMYCLRFAEALEDCRSVVDMVEKVGQPRAEILSRNISSWIQLDRHDFAQADEHARRGLEVVDRLGARRFGPLFENVLARIRLQAGDRAGALKLLEDSMAVSRDTGVAFLGPYVLGGIALASADPTRRQEALREGQTILDKGCVSHCYFWFYRDAIEVSLAEGDWGQADAYAVALASYFQEESLPWADFISARGRALAALGRGGGAPILAQIRDLRDQALRLGMKAELSRLEAALQSAPTN